MIASRSPGISMLKIRVRIGVPVAGSVGVRGTMMRWFRQEAGNGETPDGVAGAGHCPSAVGGRLLLGVATIPGNESISNESCYEGVVCALRAFCKPANSVK